MLDRCKGRPVQWFFTRLFLALMFNWRIKHAILLVRDHDKACYLACSWSRVRAVFIWVSKSNWFCVYYATQLVQNTRANFYPIRSKTKTNRDSRVRVFPRFASATCNYFVFWLAHLIICVLFDWLEWLLWFWFYDTQLKTALSFIKSHDVAWDLPSKVCACWKGKPKSFVDLCNPCES